MKSIRYIVTRPCLQEGSLRLLKYLESTFPNAGPAVLVDEKGDEHPVQVDLDRMRVWGLGGLYHAQHLGVNDVLILTTLAPGRYQVESVVKPHAPAPQPRREVPRPPETRRVVVSSTPHVREIRTQTVTPPVPQAKADAQRPETQRPDAQKSDVQKSEVRKPDASTLDAPRPEAQKSAAPQAVTPEARPAEVRVTEVRTARVQSGTAQPGAAQSAPAQRGTVRQGTVQQGTVQPSGAASASVRAVPSGGSSAPLRTLDVNFDAPAAVLTAPVAPAPAVPAPAASSPAAPDTRALDAGAQLAELAALTGYRLEHLGGGVLRLNAELGTHGYSVLVATSEDALQTPAWKENADYCVLLTSETSRPANTPCLTREALAALIEHAQLAPLSPVDLRGYWKAGSIDLESAASVAELVSSHLAQRGAFSFVLLTLAQQPAHSVVSVPRLAERLGSGVNYAELGSILDTLTRAPFLALTPLPGGQYLLRVGVPELLADLSEYAEGVRRRVRTPAREVARA
ncbi:hypothetical protein GCM10008959_33690 [Deinococcus seoulensis]|uniref:DUF4388 domain-containing protein n=1 Tax=Deinococcus seoulensis TaxID=1837379 RepID=A0ABQ2RUM8_9DEIO|nr:hypothetical protein [Deinococcus seoulensis]GGR68895.1 hypothetical protein GCM10008959_33690 [Deinococcus seoulensis]